MAKPEPLFRYVTQPDGTSEKMPTGKYRARWMGHDGSQVSKVFRTYSSAQKAINKGATEAQEIRAGLVPVPVGAAPLFRDFVIEFMDTYVKSNNKPSEQVAKERVFRIDLLPAFGDKRLDAIGARDVEHLKARLRERKLAPKSINNTLAVLATLLHYAEEVRVLATVPRIKLVKVPKQRFTFLDFDELERLIEATEAELRAAVLLGAEAGLRAGELRALRWSDLDLVAGRLTVRHSDFRGQLGSTKGGNERHVPMTARLLASLKAIRHLRGQFVLCDADGLPWREKQMELDLIAAGVRAKLPDAIAQNDRKRECRRVAKIKKAGGVPSPEQATRIAAYRAAKSNGWGWHGLRHTFCSHLAMRGAPALAIKELAGHASLSTTQRYMHLSPSAPRAAIALLEDRGGSHRVVTAGER